MDRKSTIILVACALLFALSWQLVNKLFPPIPLPPDATNQVAAATPPLQGTNAAALTNLPAPPNLTANPVHAAEFVKPTAPEQTLELTNAQAHYTFTSHGGGLKLVELPGYPETVVKGRKRAAGESRVATLNGSGAVPVLTLLDGEALQGDGLYELSRTTSGVRAEKLLPGGLQLVKEFQPGSNFLLTATVRIENRSANALTLPAQQWVVGTATPVNRQDDGLLMGVEWYDGAAASRVDAGWFANRTMGCFPGTPRTEYAGGLSNVAWVATHNQFFTLAAIPEKSAPRMAARRIELPPPTAEERAEDKRLNAQPVIYQTTLVYPEQVLAAGATVEQKFTIYAGPKEYHTLARIADQMNNNLDLLMKFDGFFGFFAKALLLSMNGLHQMLGLGYGWAIIAITVIIKLLFWPLTNASTKSMKRMAALQPQMKALQEKYKDDPQKMNQKLMEFMKENKVSPLGGCLPMLLQIPVFFGFFTMLRSAIELRGATFLWIGDLSQSDTIFTIPGLGFPVNPLPLVMGATMLWQARLTPPSPGMDPMQQRIMKYMPLMFMVFLYNYSSGLTLYWTVQNLLTIAQTKLTKTNDPTAKPAPAAPVKRKAP